MNETGTRPHHARRFPPPWSVEEQETYFVVRNHDGQELAYVYFEDEPGRNGIAIARSDDNTGCHDIAELNFGSCLAQRIRYCGCFSS
jgi:hypothetical protein